MMPLSLAYVKSICPKILRHFILLYCIVANLFSSHNLVGKGKRGKEEREEREGGEGGRGEGEGGWRGGGRDYVCVFIST